MVSMSVLVFCCRASCTLKPPGPYQASRSLWMPFFSHVAHGVPAVERSTDHGAMHVSCTEHRIRVESQRAARSSGKDTPRGRQKQYQAPTFCLSRAPGPLPQNGSGSLIPFAAMLACLRRQCAVRPQCGACRRTPQNLLLDPKSQRFVAREVVVSSGKSRRSRCRGPNMRDPSVAVHTVCAPCSPPPLPCPPPSPSAGWSPAEP